MTSEEALLRTLRARTLLQEASRGVSERGSPPDALRTIVSGVAKDLGQALPVVGAEAAYTQDDWRLALRGTPVDSMVSAFALLDRAADGASEEGPNRTISIRDIERLEALEALTCQVLDTLDELQRTASEDSSTVPRLLRRALVALDDIIAELPKREVAAAAKKLASL